MSAPGKLVRSSRWKTGPSKGQRPLGSECCVIPGRIVKTTGDGLLVEFASVVDALRCSADIQAAMAESNAPLSAEKRIDLRIGINVGDIVV
jgi:class 3 adenylate cyclase